MQMKDEDAVRSFMSSQDSLGREFDPLYVPKPQEPNLGDEWAVFKFRLFSGISERGERE